MVFKSANVNVGAFLFSMGLVLTSHCKVNLLLNILGKRTDGFHELETLFHPVALEDELRFETGGEGISLTCSDRSLPTDGRNLVHKAAQLFFQSSGLPPAVRIHLEKRIPHAAGLGGGSGNAATALLGLNQVFGAPLDPIRLQELAAELGSDVPFFLQTSPALGVGRGEKVAALEPFSCLIPVWIVLVRPPFGISTPWAYQELARFPELRNGRPGRAAALVQALREGRLDTMASGGLFNSLEGPALEKYPLLGLFQDFFRRTGSLGTLMSGSGSTTFALFANEDSARSSLERFVEHFGQTHWTAAVPLSQTAEAVSS
jgi:4-diphosphocytidyl-2-C-methyl-D-erythritol kinase